MYLTVHHFCSLLEVWQFTVFVDHKPLTFTIAKVAKPWFSCQQRQLFCISEFTTGKANLNADYLSGVTMGAVLLGLDFTRMAKDQFADQGVQELRSAVEDFG